MNDRLLIKHGEEKQLLNFRITAILLLVLFTFSLMRFLNTSSSSRCFPMCFCDPETDAIFTTKKSVHHAEKYVIWNLSIKFGEFDQSIVKLWTCEIKLVLFFAKLNTCNFCVLQLILRFRGLAKLITTCVHILPLIWQT